MRAEAVQKNSDYLPKEHPVISSGTPVFFLTLRHRTKNKEEKTAKIGLVPPREALAKHRAMQAQEIKLSRPDPVHVLPDELADP